MSTQTYKYLDLVGLENYHSSLQTILNDRFTTIENKIMLIPGSGTNSAVLKGLNATAIGPGSISLGYCTEASNDYSHAEGSYTEASGIMSHAEGLSTIASGEVSHAEGSDTTASGNYSHAEGISTEASGEASHAGGFQSIANGACSFTHGYFVETTKGNEVAFGKYNKSNTNTLFSIGNGTSTSNRKNIFEVKTNGLLYNGIQIATINDLSIELTTAHLNELTNIFK